MTPRTAISAIGQNAAGGALPTTIKRSRVSAALDRWWAEQSETDAPAVNSIRAIPRDDHRALAIIVRYSQDWLRIVSRDVDPASQRNEEQEAHRAKRLIERVGDDRDGELHVLGQRIVFVRRRYGGPEDTVPSLLEGFPLQPALPAFETAAVSEAIRYRDRLWNGLKWLCLLNADDFVVTAEALKSRAEQFASRTPEIGVHPDLGKRVGALLLWLSGDETNEIAASEVDPLLDRPAQNITFAGAAQGSLDVPNAIHGICSHP
jgi:hypothetical protein